MINKDSLLGLLDVLKENINLFSVRQSQRAKKLIFKVSIRNGLEIILPRRYKDSWVLEAVAKSQPQIERSLKEIEEARLELKPTSQAKFVNKKIFLLLDLNLLLKSIGLCFLNHDISRRKSSFPSILFFIKLLKLNSSSSFK